MIKDFLSRASFFDIETTGLDPRKSSTSIWEGAIYHEGRNTVWKRAKPISPNTGRVIPISQMSPWTQASLSQGSTPITDEILSKGLNRKPFISRMLGEMKGRDVWVQNLPFESRHLAANMSDRTYTDFIKSARLQTFSVNKDPITGKLASRRLFTTSPIVEQAVSKAWGAAPGDSSMKAWGGVWGAIKKELTQGVPDDVTRIFDIQDVSRSLFAKAQMEGYMRRSGDIFTGTSVETYSQLMEGMAESHRAPVDIKAQSRMLKSYMGMLEKMDSGTGLSIKEKDYLMSVSLLQPKLKRQNAAKTLSSAYAQIMDFRSNQGPGYPVAIGRRIKDIEAGHYTGKTISKTIPEMTYKHLTDMEDVVAQLTRSQDRNVRIGRMHRAQKVDYQSMWGSMRGALRGKENWQGALHEWEKGYKVSDEVYGSLRSGKGLPGARAGNVGDKAFSWAKKNWKAIAVGGAGILALHALTGGPNNDPLYGVDVDDPYPGDTTSPPSFSPSGKFGGVIHRKTDSSMAMYVPDSKDTIQIEDADTAILHLAKGGTHAIRMAGIDAPEVGHKDEYAEGRVLQEQPYGQEATETLNRLMGEMDSVGVLFDEAGRTSYGRTVGVLMGERDGQQFNLNEMLVKAGSAKFLPFGKRRDSIIDRGAFQRAENEAYAAHRGMWDEEGWRRVRQAEGDKDTVTNVSFTNMERMSNDFRIAALLRRQRDMTVSYNLAAGGKDDHNVIEGLPHGWFGSKRKYNTDFGSGYQGESFGVGDAIFMAGSALTGFDRFGGKGGAIGAAIGLGWTALTKGTSSVLGDSTAGDAWRFLSGGITASAATSMFASSMMKGGLLEPVGKEMSKGFSSLVGGTTKKFLGTSSGEAYLKSRGMAREPAEKELLSFLERTKDDPRGFFAVIQEGGETLSELGGFMRKSDSIGTKGVGGLLGSLTNPYVQGFLGSPKLAGAIKHHGTRKGLTEHFEKEMPWLGVTKNDIEYIAGEGFSKPRYMETLRMRGFRDKIHEQASVGTRNEVFTKVRKEVSKGYSYEYGGKTSHLLKSNDGFVSGMGLTHRGRAVADKKIAPYEHGKWVSEGKPGKSKHFSPHEIDRFLKYDKNILEHAQTRASIRKEVGEDTWKKWTEGPLDEYGSNPFTGMLGLAEGLTKQKEALGWKSLNVKDLVESSFTKSTYADSYRYIPSNHARGLREAGLKDAMYAKANRISMEEGGIGAIRKEMKGKFAASEGEMSTHFLDASAGLKDIPAEEYFKANALDLYYGAAGGLMLGGAVGALNMGYDALFGRSTFSGHDDNYNTIEGLSHKGMAGASRRRNTGFGSGWKGIFGGYKKFMAASREEIGSALRGWAGKRSVVQKGLLGQPAALQMALTSEGLSGAIFQDPHAISFFSRHLKVNPKILEEVTVAHEVSELYHGLRIGEKTLAGMGSPKRSIIDRLFGRNKTHSEEAIKSALNSSLQPTFGSHFSPSVIADELIYGAKMGPEHYDVVKRMRMWEIANQPDKAYATRTRKIIAAFEKNQLPKFSGFDDAYNTIRGLPHNGKAGASRRRNTHFGSGYKGDEGLTVGGILSGANKLFMVGASAITGYDRFGVRGAIGGAALGIGLGFGMELGKFDHAEGNLGKTLWNVGLEGIGTSAGASMLASSMMKGAFFRGKLGKYGTDEQLMGMAESLGLSPEIGKAGGMYGMLGRSYRQKIETALPGKLGEILGRGVEAQTGSPHMLDAVLQHGSIQAIPPQEFFIANARDVMSGAAAGFVASSPIAFGSYLFSGKDDAYNSIEGLPHKGMAGASRRQRTDFGSGYQGEDQVGAFGGMVGLGATLYAGRGAYSVRGNLMMARGHWRGYMDFFHGTPIANRANILAEGLVPNAKDWDKIKHLTPTDPAQKALFAQIREKGERVFFSGESWIARAHASQQVKQNIGPFMENMGKAKGMLGYFHPSVHGGKAEGAIFKFRLPMEEIASQTGLLAQYEAITGSEGVSKFLKGWGDAFASHTGPSIDLSRAGGVAPELFNEVIPTRGGEILWGEKEVLRAAETTGFKPNKAKAAGRFALAMAPIVLAGWGVNKMWNAMHTDATTDMKKKMSRKNIQGHANMDPKRHMNIYG